MAKFFKTKRAKKRMIAVLAVAMATTLSMGTFAACASDTTDEDDDTEEESTLETDTQLLQNGNFEFYSEILKDIEDKRTLINSPNSWSRSTGSDSNGSAYTSDGASGIINVADAEWKNLTTPGRAFTSVEDALAHWEDEEVTAYDRIKFLQDNKSTIKSNDDFKYYDDYQYSIDYDDVKGFYDEEKKAAKVENPKTHVGAKEGDTSVLMIQNKKITTASNASVYGTAQYYTASSALTVAAGTAAEISVWVKTSNLVHHDNQTVEKDAGAYIGLTNTVGGTTLDVMQIKNINTEKQTNADANGWVNYKLYVRASTFATTTVKLVLGLGMGSTTDTHYLVDGYAFFDDVSCKMISNAEYEAGVASLNGSYVCDANDYGADKLFLADEIGGQDTFALDLFAGETAVTLDTPTYDLTKEEKGGKTYSTMASADTYAYKDLNLVKDHTNSLGKTYYGNGTLANLTAAAAGNGLMSKVMENDFNAEKFNKAFPSNPETVMLLSTNGAPYTAKVSSAQFALEKDGRMLLSFFVKTSEMDGYTGAGVSVVDGENKTSISSIDSTTADVVNIKNPDEADTVEDIYDGWVRCFFVITNDSGADTTFSLELTYGPTAIVGSTKESYRDGYAAFTNFTCTKLNARQASYATTGTYAKEVTLTTVTTSGTTFDSVAFNAPDSIKEDIATPANYWGVTGGNVRVGGEDATAPNTLPANVYAGLINSEYTAAYESKEWKNQLVTASGISDTTTWWEQIVGKSEQPLAIINGSSATANAYGFIAQSSSTISASATQRISVRVKVSAGAKAYVYLVDTSDVEAGYKSTISANTPALTYWYDDDGNVVAKDPTKKDFDKKTDILYSLQDNRLYRNAKNAEDTAYYANLANYEKDDDGNLVTEDDAIAFYANEGKFYAYYDETTGAYTTEVTDFDHSLARYDYSGKEVPQTAIVVDGATAANKWVNVIFNIKTGSTAKDYRLEVWSGSRDGQVTNPAGSYVLFDSVVSTDGSSDYDGMLEEAKAGLEEKTPSTKEYEYKYTYTFYDDTAYLRYDATTDTDGVGNLYASYTQSTYAEATSYLYYEDGESHPDEYNYLAFFDYSVTDVTVEKDSVEEETEEEEDATEGETDVASLLLLISSIALVAALAIVIVSIGVRRILKKYRKTNPSRIVTARKPKAEKKARVKKEKPVEEEKTPTPVDENDPYNE